MKPVAVTVTCADRGQAEAIMRAAVERGLAAAGQCWPARTCYRWRGEVVSGEEYPLLLKTVESNFQALCRLIRSLHSYQLPSIAMIPILEGGPGYREWLMEAAGPGAAGAGRDPVNWDSG